MVTCACCGPTEVSKGQSCVGCLRDFLEGNTAPKSSSRTKSPGAGIMEKKTRIASECQMPHRTPTDLFMTLERHAVNY